jgi:hypothetical protein
MPSPTASARGYKNPVVAAFILLCLFPVLPYTRPRWRLSRSACVRTVAVALAAGLISFLVWLLVRASAHSFVATDTRLSFSFAVWIGVITVSSGAAVVAVAAALARRGLGAALALVVLLLSTCLLPVAYEAAVTMGRCAPTFSYIGAASCSIAANRSDLDVKLREFCVAVGPLGLLAVAAAARRGRRESPLARIETSTFGKANARAARDFH